MSITINTGAERRQVSDDVGAKITIMAIEHRIAMKIDPKIFLLQEMKDWMATHHDHIKMSIGEETIEMFYDGFSFFKGKVEK